jgi:hypothetical protein
MKAHLPPKNWMTNTQKKAADTYVRQQQEAVCRRIFKLMAVSLNDLYGFGKWRTSRLMADITAKVEDDDPVFWTHIDRRVHQIGLELKDEDWREGFS